MNLNNIDSFFPILNAVLFEGREKFIYQKTLSSDEWEQVFRFISSQALLPVFIEGLSYLPKECLPEKSCLLKYIGLSERQKNGYRGRLNTMQRLSSLFLEKGLNIMYIKGATLAQMYPKPEWRVCGDIDYYMFGESDESIRILEESGVKTQEYFHHHTQAEMNGILLENHYDFFDRVNHRCNRELDDFLKSLANKEGYSYPFLFEGAYQMTPTMNAVFLMRHMSAHFVSETVTFRQLYDWALFLRNQSKDVDWKKVVELYLHSKMMAFARIIQFILNEKMMVSTEGVPIEVQDGMIAEKVWRSILNPPETNSHKKYGIRYYAYEIKTFFGNRWKHKLVYPDESYLRLAFTYVKSHLKKKLHLLSH